MIKWPMLLLTEFMGKPQKAYTALSVEDGTYYNIVKSVIFKTYKLVPEAYRQSFRKLRNGQTIF